MKKCIWLLPLLGLLTACTTKEQDEQIQSFWSKQFTQVVSKVAPGQAALLASRQRTPAAEEQDMQEFEDMMKEWEQTQASLAPHAPDALPETTPAAPQPAVPPQAAKNAPATTTTKPAAPAKTAKPLNAYLIVSSTCGWCKKLKQERWPENFREKYRGQIRLIEYDVNTTEGREGYNRLLRRYKLSSTGTPTLFIGDSVVRGYPLEEADSAAKKALAKYGKNVARAPKNQFMEITMEDSSGTVKGKAPLKDRQAMQRAIDKVLQDNQNTVQDIGQIFGSGIQAEAFAITTQTEKSLRRKAAASANLQEYLKAQRQLLKQQEQSLNQLMQQNAQFLRNIH